MPRSRVPIRGSIGKSILTGQKSTVVQQTIVQQVVKGSTSGVGAVAATIWPLISQIPINVSDLAALTTAGIVVDTGSHIIARTLAVNTPLTIANPTGAGGNPTISLTTAALTKTDDTNVTVALGGTPGSALVAATSLTLGWTGQLAVPRGGSGAATLTGYLKGNGTSPFTANATIPATDITGLATVATTGAYSDLSGTPTIPADISGLTYVTASDETADAPNSLQLIAGTNVTFDTSTPNQLKIDATGGGSSPLTTKGDLFGYDTADARIPVGTDGQVLTADSTDPLGVSWQTASGTGTVTSVDVSVPSILTISGNPITTSGTLAFDLATQNANLVLAGPTTGSPAKPTFRALVIADIPTIPAAHTSGFATVATTGAYSDLSGTPSLAAIATSGSATDLTTGTVPSARLPTASTSVLGAVKVDGTTITISGGVISSTGGGGTGANPTASVGLTAVNGTATTFLRSDGAPALDQGIAPTWSGSHRWTGALVRSPSLLGFSVGVDGGAVPAAAWNNSGGGTDSKIWEMYADATNLVLITVNDAVSASKNAMLFTRSGTALTAVVLGNTTDKPTITLNGPTVIPAPASGTSLQINGVGGGTSTVNLTSPTGTANTLASGATLGMGNGSTTGTVLSNNGGQTELWQFDGSSWNQVITLTAGRTVAISAPATGNIALDTFGVNGQWCTVVRGGAGAGGAYGLLVRAGTNTSDFSFYIQDQTGVTDYFRVRGDGAIQGRGPVAGGIVDMTPDASSFTGTMTGFTAGITNTCVWSRNGNQVTLFVGAATGTSNANTFTMTGLPAAIQPARTQLIALAFNSLENLGAVIGSTESMQVNASSGTVTFLLSGNAAGWGTSGVKGVMTAFTVTYLLN